MCPAHAMGGRLRWGDMGEQGDNPKPLPYKRALFVAAFIGTAAGNATEAARIAGYADPKQQGSRLLTFVDVKAAVAAHRAAVEAQGISVQQNRVDAYNERWRLMNLVIAHRSTRYTARFDTDDPAVAAAQSARAVFGGDVLNPKGGGTPYEATTGLLVEKETVNNAGHRTTEWSVDTGLLAEMRATELQAAKELGQLTEKHEVAGGIHREYVIVRDAAAATPPPAVGG